MLPLSHLTRFSAVAVLAASLLPAPASGQPASSEAALFAPTPTPTSAPTFAPTIRPVAPSAEALLDSFAASGFAGSVLVARGGSVELVDARGMATEGDAARTGTAYDVGSLAKGLTNAAVLRLAEDGRLRLTDPVGRYVPGLPRAVRGASLESLMRERAGFGAATVAMQREDTSLSEAAQAVGRVPLKHAAGPYAATDLGHVLLARVVEVAAGRSFVGYLRAAVLVEAGLVETELPGEAWRSERFVARAGEDARAYPLPSWEEGIGGVRMTASDLWRWTRYVSRTPALAALGACGVAGGVCASEGGGFGAVVVQRGASTAVVLTNTPRRARDLAAALAGASAPTFADSLR
jgi:CubicO group peptidase (beta-lactamase class C family)